MWDTENKGHNTRKKSKGISRMVIKGQWAQVVNKSNQED